MERYTSKDLQAWLDYTQEHYPRTDGCKFVLDKAKYAIGNKCVTNYAVLLVNENNEYTPTHAQYGTARETQAAFATWLLWAMY